MSQLVPRVYALGNSPLCLLVSHALSTLPRHQHNPQIVALLRSEKELRQFLNNNSTVSLKQYVSHGNFHQSSTQLLSACRPPEVSNGTPAVVDDLILSMNHQFDINELQKYKKCLTSESNILLLNGDRNSTQWIFDKVWKNPLDRPNMYQVISDFRVWSESPFETSILGDGSLKISKIPSYIDDFSACNYDLGRNLQNECNIVKFINESRLLNPTFVNYGDFALLQAEHMIIKTVIGSLTALFDCKNGELLHMRKISNLVSTHVDECIAIIQKADPLLSQIPYSPATLNRDRIRDVIFTFLKQTDKESTQMRREFNHWSKIEIQQTVGYFAGLAIEKKVRGTHNITLNRLLHAKLALKKYRDVNEDSYTNEKGIDLYI